MSKKIIRDLTPYTDDESMENQLRVIAARQQEIFSTMLDIVDFFNNVFVGDTEEGEIGGIKTYLVNINRILSVTYNNSIVSIKYKTLDDTERVINFKSNINNNTVEVETGPVIRVVNKSAKDIIAFQNLTKKDGDIIYLEAVDQIILVEEVDGELSSNVPLSDKTLYYYPQGNKIFYKVGKSGQSYFKVGSGLAFDEGFKGENYTPNPENVVRSSDLYNEFRKIWNYLGESQSGNPGYQQPWDEEDPESGSNTGEVSDSELDANGNSFTIFDYTKGNPGAFAFKKAVENITVEDVDNAYRVPLPPEFIDKGFKTLSDIPIINSETDTRAGLWTAKRIGLSENNSGVQNRNNVIAAIADDTCLGFYLDKVYNIVPPRGTSKFTGTPLTTYTDDKGIVSGSISPVYAKDNNININKDFIISGAGGGSVKGGFRCECNLFYTEASLYLYNFRLHLTQGDTYPTIFVNLENGVDQIQIINCEFTSDGYNDHVPVTTYNDKGTKGHYMLLYSPNTCPYKLKAGETYNSYNTRYNGEVVTIREVSDYNYINHICVKDSAFMGTIMNLHGGARVVKTARFIRNTVTDLTGVAINWGCPNYYDKNGDPATWDMYALSYGKNQPEGQTYLSVYDNNLDRWVTTSATYFNTLRACMSCPVYIVGNSFSGGEENGKPIIYVNEKSDGSYRCAALIENSASYFLHNTVKNNVTGVHNPENTTKRNVLETYSTYENCMQVYFANNKIQNIVKFAVATNSDNNSGECKSKSLNYSATRGGILTVPFSRCYKNNEYLLDYAMMKLLWTEHMQAYVTANDTTSRNYLYDKALDDQINSDDDKALSIHFAESTIDDKGTTLLDIYELYPTRPVVSKGYYHHYVFKEWIFSNNIVDAGQGHIWGMARNNQVSTAKFECKNNKFKASRFSSDLWDERNCLVNRTDPPSYLFSIKLAKIPRYGDSVFDVSNNEFTDTNPDSNIDDHARIRFIVNSFYTSEQTSTYNNGALSLTSNCKTPKEGNISTLETTSYVGNKNVVICIDGYDLDVNNKEVVNIKEFAFNIPNPTPEVPQKDYGDVGRQLGITEIENPVHGDMYMVEVDGEVKVKEYIDTDSHTILSFRCNTAFKPGTLNVENAVIPLNTSNNNVNISLSASQLLTYFGSLDEEVRDDQIDEFLQVLNPNIEEGGEGYSTKQVAFNNIVNASNYTGKINNLVTYITTYGLIAYLNTPTDLCLLLKCILLCNNYTFKGYVNNSNKNTADYVEQTDSKCFDILEQGGSLFVRVVPENDGDDYTIARSYFYTTTPKGSHSIKNVEFANVLSHAAWFPYSANTYTVNWGKYNSTIGTVGGWVISEKNPGVDNKLYYLSQKYGDTEQQTIGG